MTRKQENLAWEVTINKLATKFRDEAFEGKCDCPECGDKGVHDTNGSAMFSQLSILCRQCGTQFDAEEVWQSRR